MEAVLVHVRSDGKQQLVPLKAGKVVLGRENDCQVRIPSGQVSRHHCELNSCDTGLQIRDLGSSNGTFVNGQKVEEAELAAGDVIGVGSMLFVVQIDGQPDHIDPEELGQRVRSAASAAAAPTPDSDDTPASFVDNDDSSVDFDFDFDLSDDDDDDQPEL